MKPFSCRCGNALFFESTQCTACGAACGWCDACRTVTTLVGNDESLHCGNEACGAKAVKCVNRVDREICNCHFPPSPDKGGPRLCRSCQTTSQIPDLSVEQNVIGWRALETAKRRLLYQLDLLGLEYRAEDNATPPLTFRFLADTPAEHFPTGHENGVVTINLRETKPVEQEKERQKFGEPHRTLIGHFRHEVSHYFWQTLVDDGQNEESFIALFGDHNNPNYAEAMPRYYEAGPPDDWNKHYISRYAAAHPWEDFAETAGFYFDMCGVLDTVAYRLEQQVRGRRPPYAFEQMLADYRRLGVIFNEVNRSMGIADLLPEVVSGPVVEKLRYVDDLFTSSAATPARCGGE